MYDDFLHFSDTFLAVVTSATEVGNTRPSAIHPESVARIHEVCFCSLTASTWDELPAVDDAFGSSDAPDLNFRDTYVQSAPVFEHPCLPLTKILSSGSFYYSVESQWDISSRLAVRLSRDPSALKEHLIYDERFVWNEYIIRSLLDFRERLDPIDKDDLDSCRFLVSPRVYLTSTADSALDSCYSRLCWGIYDGSSSTAN